MQGSRVLTSVLGATMMAVVMGSVLGQQHAAVPGGAANAPGADRLANPEQLAGIRAQAQASLERGDLAGAISEAQRFVKAGGAEADVRPLLVQAYLRTGDYANAARELQWEMDSAERAGRPPPEQRLLLLQHCYAKLNDANAYVWVLEKLVTWYPKKEYWSELLDRMQKRADFGEPLALDVSRLRFAAGAMNGPQDWIKYAAQADAAGYPAEAKAVIEKGIARGELGAGPDSAKHRMLLQQYAAAAQVQRRKLADPQLEIAGDKAKEGIGLVDTGFALVTFGEFARGIALMERGIKKDPWLGGKPQIAKLHLGVAYYLAGNRARATQVFNTVGGKHGGADLGRMWAIQAQHAR